MHPDFDLLGTSWELALDADGYARNSITSYRRSLRQLAGWLPAGVGPAQVNRDQIRGFLVHTRTASSSGTARSWFAGIRHFYRWMVAEGEIAADPTAGIRTPPPNDPRTPVLSVDDIKAMLRTCVGDDFVAKRDRAIIRLFVDGGLRLAELAGLNLTDVEARERVVFVAGKGSNRSGPRRRAVPVGVKTAQALDRYVRERRRHPYADLPALWLGARGRPSLSTDGVAAMLGRRAAVAGLSGIHAHMFRHTWADAFRREGGEEGDLMTLGGWRSRAMLDRYGKTNAETRAREAYRLRSFGDRL